MLGVSSFITQMSIVCVMAAENNLLGKYGAQSDYGAETPITVLGIVMKIQYNNWYCCRKSTYNWI